ncbi:MAG TPA: peptidyl-prolyl cis-trans isomerase [Candidatus Udaeobacter sp.]|jgi:parvulin-like peptidyl-prolyl isomerase|nr:peptidyl-prolyl cis-trans isomerase [Candidatus Udaeobacter sp.]
MTQALPSRLVALVVALLVGTAALPLAAAPAKTLPVKHAAAHRDTAKVLVRVGNEAITNAMVQERIDALPDQYRAQYTTPTGRQQVLDRMVEEKVWLTVALRNGVASRPKVREQLEQQRRDLLIRTWINEQMALNPPPSDSEVRAYYEAHINEYKTPPTAVVRHIETRTEADARRVLGTAREPKRDFAELAQKFSTDTLTRKNGGLLGTVSRDGSFPILGMQPALAESVFALGEGKIGGPYKTDRGWHVIKVDHVEPASTRSFDQTRALIVRQLSGQRTQDFYRRMLEKARHDVGVHPDSSAIRNFVSARKTPREMFKEAQEASGAPARIEGYQRVLDLWPDSDVAPQAQFMIGFVRSEELKDYDGAEKAFRALLQRYPKSELGSSAHWMIDHMRTEEAPAFVTQQADSAASATQMKGKEPQNERRKTGSSGKP